MYIVLYNYVIILSSVLPELLPQLSPVVEGEAAGCVALPCSERLWISSGQVV